ncbi:MAG: HupE/UreJ family protein, partial [Verrucomicrobiaceae bacterium]
MFLTVVAALSVFGPGAAMAHVDAPTLILVRAESPEEFSVKIDVDLSPILGSPEIYHRFVLRNPGNDDAELHRAAASVRDQLQIVAGAAPLDLEFKSFTGAEWAEGEVIETGSAGKRSTFYYTAAIPKTTEPIRLITPVGMTIEYPLAFTVQVPSKDISVTRWLVTGMRQTDDLDWINKPRQTGPDLARGDPSRLLPAFDPDTFSWWKQFRVYLQLGFHHIIPEGMDHILFVIGLYFLGVSWRYLLSQTTIFTVAHATTLFLSTYG